MVTIVSGDLLTSTDDFIGHQCNCVTRSALGLAYQLFQKFPWANTYRTRTKPSEPGSIEFFTVDERQYIVNLYAQYQPGANRTEPRLKWFEMCLNEFARIVGDHVVTLSLPYLIGCGLAGGSWSDYEAVITQFAEAHPNIKMTLYKKEPASPGPASRFRTLPRTSV